MTYDTITPPPQPAAPHPQPWTVAPLPDAVFACAMRDCGAEQTYPPDMLYWHEGPVVGKPGEVWLGWFCEDCLEAYSWDEDNGPPDRAITLEAEILRRGLTVPGTTPPAR